MIRFFADPGHGGHDPGAVGPSGLKESAMALDVCLKMRHILEPVEGLEVMLSREDDDTFHSLSHRGHMANEWGADFFLSVHFNSAESSSARGHEVFTTPGETAADPFATDLFRSYEQDFPELPARKSTGDGDPDKEANFTVLRAARAPAALYECEFISNPQGEAMIRQEANRWRMALALANGFLRHAGLVLPEAGTPVPVPPSAPAAPAAPEIAQIKERIQNAEWQLMQARKLIEQS